MKLSFGEFFFASSAKMTIFYTKMTQNQKNNQVYVFWDVAPRGNLHHIYIPCESCDWIDLGVHILFGIDFDFSNQKLFPGINLLYLQLMTRKPNSRVNISMTEIPNVWQQYILLKWTLFIVLEKLQVSGENWL